VAVYTDKASLFQVTPRAIHHRDAPEKQLSPDRTGAEGTEHRVQSRHFRFDGSTEDPVGIG
jgi:hypothetical protein